MSPQVPKQTAGSKAPFKARREIGSFAELMELKLSLHDEKRGDGWKNEPVEFFMARLDEELAELREAVKAGNMKQIQYEAADVANFLMMLSWKVEDDWAEELAKHAPAWVGGCSR